MMRAVRPTSVLAVLGCVLLIGCGESTAPPSAAPGPAANAAQPADGAAPTPASPNVPASAPAATPAAKRQERPLPAFEGTTLDGQPFSVAQLLGRRTLLKELAHIRRDFRS